MDNRSQKQGLSVPLREYQFPFSFTHLELRGGGGQEDAMDLGESQAGAGSEDS